MNYDCVDLIGYLPKMLPDKVQAKSWSSTLEKTVKIEIFAKISFSHTKWFIMFTSY